MKRIPEILTKIAAWVLIFIGSVAALDGKANAAGVGLIALTGSVILLARAIRERA